MYVEVSTMYRSFLGYPKMDGVYDGEMPIVHRKPPWFMGDHAMFAAAKMIRNFYEFLVYHAIDTA